MKKLVIGVFMSVALSSCASVENKEVASAEAKDTKSAKSSSLNCETGRKRTGSRLARKICK